MIHHPNTYRALARDLLMAGAIQDADFASQFAELLVTVPPNDHARASDLLFAQLKDACREYADGLDVDTVIGFLAIQAGLVSGASLSGFTGAGLLFKIGQFAYGDDELQPHFLVLFDTLLEAARRAGFGDCRELRRAMALQRDPLLNEELARLLRETAAAIGGEQAIMHIAADTL